MMPDTYERPSLNRGPFYVFLGPLDHINNKPSFYAYPTEQAAQRAADEHRRLHPQRAVAVRAAGAT